MPRVLFQAVMSRQTALTFFFILSCDECDQLPIFAEVHYEFPNSDVPGLQHDFKDCLYEVNESIGVNHCTS